MTEIPLDFFNLEMPCPGNVPNCENLREEYKAELQNLKDQGICNSCAERGLRNKYLAVLLTNLNK